MREIRFQLDAFMSGWQKTLAARLNVSPATISRRADAWDWDADERDAMLVMIAEHAQLAQRLWVGIQAMPVHARASKAERIAANIAAMREGAALEKQREDDKQRIKHEAFCARWPLEAAARSTYTKVKYFDVCQYEDEAGKREMSAEEYLNRMEAEHRRREASTAAFQASLTPAQRAEQERHRLASLRELGLDE